VQASAIGYPDTTGLRMIDYRMTDSVADPPGTADELHTETLLRLPGCFLCYRPFEGSPQVAPLPALTNGFVTFGSFNSLPKVTADVIALWASILGSLPGSRLIMKCAQLGDMPTRARVQQLFLTQSISSDRIELCGEIPSLAEHLDLYNRVDVALDPFPYNGTTTTCEALWMGVPVITLAGDRHAARVGVSLLSAVGLPDLTADSHQTYGEKAVSLARDVQRLQSLRAGLRERMGSSALTDAAGFTRGLEKAYRSIWRAWCRTVQQPGAASC
jgi:predicted O-linked N-acetylglucosamine transferase (SPINDLY family)